MLRVENVSKSFINKKNKKLVLDDVSLKINKGEIVGIIGKSGGGKSTLARIIGGEIPIDCGQVYLNNIPLYNKKKYNRKIGKSIQIIPQQPYSSLDDNQAVGKALKEILLVNKICERKNVNNMVEKLLGNVLLDKELYNHLPNQLSGGQVQRIVIARALAIKPKLIISDEATSMLDTVSQAQIIQIFKKLVRSGISILFVSHDIDLVNAICDRYYNLENNKLFEKNIKE